MITSVYTSLVHKNNVNQVYTLRLDAEFEMDVVSIATFMYIENNWLMHYLKS